MTIVLLQVLPGNEEETYRQIKNWRPKLAVYKGLGRYDLVLVEESNDLSLLDDFRSFLPSPIFLHNYIIDVNYICGFQWSNPNKKLPESSPPPNKKTKILGICCIKLKNETNPDQIAKEQRIVNAIYEKAKENTVEIEIYGGFGWNEIISIIRCDSVLELTSSIESIKQALLGEDCNCFLDTSTIPCVDFSQIAERKLEELTEKIDITVLIGSRHPDSDLEAFCQAQFGSVSTAFGFHDFVIFCKQMCLGSYLQKILDTRKQEGVLYTYSVLSHKDRLKEPIHKIALNKDIKPNLNSKMGSEESTSKAISLGTGDHETNLITHYMNLFDILRNDPLTIDLFPIFGIWNRLFQKLEEVRKYEKSDPDEYRKAQQVFYSNIDCLRTLFIERYMDVPLANLLGGKSPVSEVFGGSSRLIKAAESIAVFFGQIVGEKWTGVCIHGYYDRYYRLYAGIINVPGKDLLNPGRFWGLYHETGHEVFNLLKDHLPRWHRKIEKSVKDQLRMFEKDDIADIEEHNLRLRWGLSEEEKKSILKKDILEEERRTRHYANELFAELFSFRFGFAKDWSIWKGEVWSWFTAEFGPRVEFLTRSILLGLTLGPYEGSWPAQRKQKIDAIIKELETTTPASKNKSAHITDEIKKLARINVGKFLEIALVIRKLLYSLEVESRVPFESLSQVFASLSSGIPVKVISDNVDITPQVVVNALVVFSKTENNTVFKTIDLRTKVSTIMSLYNYYVAHR